MRLSFKPLFRFVRKIFATLQSVLDADRTALEAMMQYTEKRVYVDLRRFGWIAEKAEGLCLMEDGTLVVMIEYDFGLAGAELRKGADTVTLVPNTGGDAAKCG